MSGTISSFRTVLSRTQKSGTQMSMHQLQRIQNKIYKLTFYLIVISFYIFNQATLDLVTWDFDCHQIYLKD